MAEVSHYNVAPVIDIYGSVQGRDLGGVSRDINKIIDQARRQPAARLASGRARPGADDARLVYRLAGRTGVRDRARTTC